MCPKNKVVKKVKVLSKSTRIKRSLTTLQRNVNLLLKEFKAMDALDVKIAKAAKKLKDKKNNSTSPKGKNK